MTAYDYSKQEWVDGERAVALRQGQLTSDLALLTGDKGAEFARFLGVDRHLAIEQAKAQLMELHHFGQDRDHTNHFNARA